MRGRWSGIAGVSGFQDQDLVRGGLIGWAAMGTGTESIIGKSWQGLSGLCSVKGGV